MDDDRWLPASKVAEMIGMSRTSVWRIDREKLPYIVTRGGAERAGQRRYRQSDVERYVSDQQMTLAERVSQLEERITRLEDGPACPVQPGDP